MPPIYSKTNPADAPVLTLALTFRMQCRFRRWKTWRIRGLRSKILVQLPGVGLVSISGGQKPAGSHPCANPAQMSAYGLNMEDLQNFRCSTAANVNQAKGNFDGPRQYTYQIGANDQLLFRAGDYAGTDHRL